MTNDSLNRISQIVFMFTCFALVALAGIKVWGDRSAMARAAAESAISVRAQETPLPVGSKLQPIEGISFSKSHLTIALVLQSTCPYCTESMGFYKRISELRGANKFQIVALSTESSDVIKNYVGKHGLVVDAVASLKGPEIPTTGTPTLVLVTNEGTVDASWIGRLSPAQENDVIERIHRAAARARAS